MSVMPVIREWNAWHRLKNKKKLDSILLVHFSNLRFILVDATYTGMQSIYNE